MIKDIDTSATFDYNPSNGVPFLRVDPGFSDKTKDILFRGSIHLKIQTGEGDTMDFQGYSRGGWTYQHLADFIITQLE